MTDLGGVYRAVVEAASPLGARISVVAALVLVADIAALAIYALRQGLVSKAKFVSMESLLDGRATFGERMMVLGIITVFVSFFSIFLGVGLMLMKDLVIAVLFPIVPGIFVCRFARDAWHDYLRAKKHVARRSG